MVWAGFATTARPRVSIREIDRRGARRSVRRRRQIAVFAAAFVSAAIAANGQPPAPMTFPGSVPTPAPSAVSQDPNEYHPPLRRTTNQLEFAIPLLLDPNLPEAQRPVEAQLYVSSDLGANWTLYAREQPDSKQFTFQSTREGEYWFALRTKDRDERLSPSGPLRAELVVIVDTRPPTLELKGRRNEKGELEATWRASDERLDAATFAIEALIPGETQWRSLALNQPGRATPTALDGIGKWVPPTDLSGVQLRAEIRDLAGNRTVATETLPQGLPPVAIAPTTTGAGASGPNVAGSGTASASPPNGSVDVATASNGTSSASAAGGDSLGRFASGPLPTGGSSFPRTSFPTNGEGGASATAGATASGSNSPYPAPPPIGAGDASGVLKADAAGPSSVGSSSGSTTQSLNSPPPSTAFPGAGGSSLDPSASPPTNPGGAYPPTARTYGDPAVPGDEARQSPLPPGERPLMTNRRSFNLEYDLDRVGSAELSNVELWATRDGGRSWQKWGTDADVKSPFPVNVEAEGTYGFRIVVVGKNGLASPSPRSGEPADAWVGVDWTSPRARLTAAPFVDGPNAGQLRITWEAADEALGERPIGLYFAATPDGPWQSIAQGLPNVGQYFWKVDPRAPNRVYLKIEATDAAGNVGTDRIVDPIDLRGLVPSAKIRGISLTPEPTEPTASTSWLPSWLWR